MSLIDDIATDLVNAGLGVLGISLFKTYLPDNTAECLAIYDTGGTLPNVELPDIKNLTFQILIRSATYNAGKTKMDNIRARLHGVKNRTIGSTYFYYIGALSEGGHIGRNEKGQDEFSINFQCKTR